MSGRKVIAVSGGIGAGKSMVCRILEKMAFPVYDCDSRAKAIMDSDPNIIDAIKSEIGECAVNTSGRIDRKALSEVVFADRHKLERLNRIVHGAVLKDIISWADAQSSIYVFVETAILYQSGIDKIVDYVWEVTAPEDLRIRRVCERSALTPVQVKARIDSQRVDVECPHPRVMMIDNDYDKSLLLQIHHLFSISR